VLQPTCFSNLASIAHEVPDIYTTRALPMSRSVAQGAQSPLLPVPPLRCTALASSRRGRCVESQRLAARLNRESVKAPIWFFLAHRNHP
jgi:hypothetical protein